MPKLGYKKGQNASTKGVVVHAYVPGPAYNIDNPIQKMINVIGTFFNEPSYYDSEHNKSTGLTEQAQGVVDAAHALAEASPEDLLIIAAWARDKRDGLKLRVTPQVLFAIGATHEKTRKLLPKYATKIMTRADDIRTAFASYNALFVSGEKRSLPAAFKHSLGVALANQNAYQLIKYNTDVHPTFRDVIAMIKGKRSRSVAKDATNGYPLTKGLYEYLCFGKVSEGAPDIVRKRAAFFQNKDISVVTIEQVEEAGLTWENVLSHFGNKLEVWKLCVPVMGEMALTRNFRNFEQAGFSREDWKKVEEAVLKDEKTVQLPFRFLSAYDHVITSEAKTLIGRMFDKSCNSVPILPGLSVTYVDNSGSMSSRVSGNSTVTQADAGNTLSAILAKQNGGGCDSHTFGDFVGKVTFNHCDSGITLLQNIRKMGAKTGHGTNIGAIVKNIDEYRQKKIVVNRFIILSDMCCYHMGRGTRGLQQALDQYRQQVNKDCYLYSINLAGHAQTQVNPNDNNIIIMSGWSESIFRLMLDAEGASREQPEIKNTVLPTIEELRKRYKVS